ncbi:hypothetical protein B0H11DRAFT_1903778 [Mycena galericulata]|nr:hypothetical protein B0H11DRAFT_1903778 [Mycena galericulata]
MANLRRRSRRTIVPVAARMRRTTATSIRLAQKNRLGSPRHAAYGLRSVEKNPANTSESGNATTPSYEPLFWDTRARSYINLRFPSVEASEEVARGTAPSLTPDEHIASQALAALATGIALSVLSPRAASVDCILRMADQLSALSSSAARVPLSPASGWQGNVDSLSSVQRALRHVAALNSGVLTPPTEEDVVLWRQRPYLGGGGVDRDMHIVITAWRVELDQVMREARINGSGLSDGVILGKLTLRVVLDLPCRSGSSFNINGHSLEREKQCEFLDRLQLRELRRERDEETYRLGGGGGGGLGGSDRNCNHLVDALAVMTEAVESERLDARILLLAELVWHADDLLVGFLACRSVSSQFVGRERDIRAGVEARLATDADDEDSSGRVYGCLKSDLQAAATGAGSSAGAPVALANASGRAAKMRGSAVKGETKVCTTRIDAALEEEVFYEVNEAQMSLDVEDLEEESTEERAARIKEARGERMSIRNRVVNTLFNQISPEERTKLDELIAEEKEAAAAKAKGENKSTDGERTPAEYLRAIDESAEVFAKVHKTIASQTGWHGFSVYGGPNPRFKGALNDSITDAIKACDPIDRGSQTSHNSGTCA